MAESRRVVITQFGSPDVLSIRSEDLGPPSASEVQIRQTAIGFNFIDIYHRKGIYPLPLPTGLGYEAAGVVETIGSDVADIKPGDRVAYVNAGPGAYANRRNVASQHLVKLPDQIGDDAAAALLFKGLTAQYLLRATHAVREGDLLLVHSASGGVGLILTQWATALGATVIGTTGSPHKTTAALAAGCTAVIDLNDPDWPEAFLKATNGRKAEVVYDAVGKDTLIQSLDCAAAFGLVVSYGSASGKAPDIDPGLLNAKGNLFFTSPSVFAHNSDPRVLRNHADDLFDVIEKGHVEAKIGQRFKLDQIAEAHRAAEERRVEGAILIVP